MVETYIYECGAVDNRSSEVQITNRDFAIAVGDKSYRFQIDRDGNLILPLINGVDCKITAYYGYPAVKLIDQTTK